MYLTWLTRHLECTEPEHSGSLGSLVIRNIPNRNILPHLAHSSSEIFGTGNLAHSSSSEIIQAGKLFCLTWLTRHKKCSEPEHSGSFGSLVIRNVPNRNIPPHLAHTSSEIIQTGTLFCLTWLTRH